ncbi:unnamed protein product [Protopolystoma xenopodis]|uniref:PurA ssDNA and RNA-binding protein n=1 Tax=Protopolystoma xenopodis TaxID=117903 RepID=A0A448X633_9PLAT|nr:unnamed protein product [Protopolystoma xenopodis]
MMNPLMYRHQPGPHFPVLPYVHGMMPPRSRFFPHSDQMIGEINDEEDLASVSLQIQKKRFYVDVGVDGRKSRILLTMPAAADLRDKLKDLIDVLNETEKKQESEEGVGENVAGNGEKSTENAMVDGLIKSHIVNYPNRRYYLDLKKNRRGIFLRLAMLSAYVRIQLAVPAQGMPQLLSIISDLLGKWWDGSAHDDLKASKSLRVDNKMFYFDSLTHPHRVGVFLRISEVKSDSRTAITIPARSLTRFRDVINELAENLANVKEDTDEKPESKTLPGAIENGDTRTHSEDDDQ